MTINVKILKSFSVSGSELEKIHTEWKDNVVIETLKSGSKILKNYVRVLLLSSLQIVFIRTLTNKLKRLLGSEQSTR